MENNLSFESLPLGSNIKNAIKYMGYSNMTKVQSKVLPLILEGQNVICKSHTGSGKTAAFAIPLTERVLAKSSKHILVLCPTRELAVQVSQEFINLNKNTGLKAIPIYGGHGIQGEVNQLRKTPSFICATPGRLADHIRHHVINPKMFDTVVLDEADRMLDMGFVDQIMEILGLIMPKNIHLFSATLDGKVANVIDKYILKYEEVIIDDEIIGTDIIETNIKIDSISKFATLKDILQKHMNEKVLIFISTKRGADNIHRKLEQNGFKIACIHGNHSQSKREHSLQEFKSGVKNILVATDVAARGLQIDDIKLVVNYDMANTDDLHKHRVGRTGRMGHKGEAINFVEEGVRRNRVFKPKEKITIRNNDDSFYVPEEYNNSESLGGERPNHNERRRDFRKPRFGGRNNRNGSERFGGSRDKDRKPRFGNRDGFEHRDRRDGEGRDSRNTNSRDRGSRFSKFNAKPRNNEFSESNKSTESNDGHDGSISERRNRPDRFNRDNRDRSNRDRDNRPERHDRRDGNRFGDRKPRFGNSDRFEHSDRRDISGGEGRDRENRPRFGGRDRDNRNDRSNRSDSRDGGRRGGFGNRFGRSERKDEFDDNDSERKNFKRRTGMSSMKQKKYADLRKKKRF